MRTPTGLLALLSCVLAAFSVVGCGESAPQRTADEIRRQVGEARQRHLKGVQLFAASDPTGPGAADALAAWNEAARILNEALNAPDASPIAQQPAHALTADVQAGIAGFHLHAARVLASESVAMQRAVEWKLTVVESHAAESAFLSRPAPGTGEALRPLHAAAEAQARAAAELVEQLTDRQRALQDEMAAIDRANEPEIAEVARLRDAAASDRIKGLDLLSRAEDIQRQINARTAGKSELADRVAVGDQQIALQSDRLASADKQVETIRQGIERRLRARQQRQARQAQLDAALQAVGGQLVEDAESLGVLWSKTLGEYQKATEAFDRAAAAARRASAGASALKREAGQLRGDNPDSPTKAILSWLAGAASTADAQARTGRIELRSAETRREILSALAEMNALATRLAAAVGSTGTQMPAGVEEAIAQVRGEDHVSAARSAYESAEAAFKSLAQIAARERGDRAQAWPYQCERARALLGMYRLSVQAGEAQTEHLNEARTVVREILEQHEDRPAFLAPAYQLERILTQGG